MVKDRVEETTGELLSLAVKNTVESPTGAFVYPVNEPVLAFKDMPAGKPTAEKV
jgi:hypothetical protein